MTRSSITDRPSFLSRARRYAWLILALVIGLTVAHLMHWDDRGQLWLAERFESHAERKASVWLPDYVVSVDAKKLPGMEDDEASDVSFDPATKTLFSVMGKHPFLVELSLKGDVLRKIPLVGWSNPEAVAVLENSFMAIVDERQHSLVIVKVTPQTTSLNIADFRRYDLGPSEHQNKAFEGAAWDPRRQQILLGEERPAALYSWKSNGSDVLEGDKQKITTDALEMRNLSSLTVEPRTGHTLALSADSHMLLELDESGKQVSFMTLLGGFNGLKDTIPRAEGVALDDDGNLYIVSEPNLFYSFHKK